MEESPKVRATSSEPSSGRPNPFEDVTDPPSRKRQKVSRRTSRNRWTDDDGSSDTIQDSNTPAKENASSDPEQTPSTASHKPSESLTEQKSSSVTINLRTSRHFDTIPSSPSSPSPMTPLKKLGSVNESVESENEAIQPPPAMETPSSSPFLTSSPHVELLPIEETELLDPDPPVALIEGTQDEDDHGYHDIISKFPYHAESETLLLTLNKILRFFQFDEIVNEEAFCKLRDWIDHYLLIISNTDLFYDNYINHRDFWVSFPEIIWALSHRQKYFGDFLRRSREGRQALTGMFCQFGRLCGRFLAMDIRTLAFQTSDNAAIEPDLGSWQYLNALGHLLRKDESPHIGKNLEDHYQWNFDEDILQICDGFQAEGGTISALTKLVEYHFNLTPITLKNVELLSFPSRIVESMIRTSEIALENKKTIHDQVLAVIQRTIMMSYEYFISTSMGLEAIIEKHITSLSPDAAVTHLQCLAYILKLVLKLDNNITRRILKENAQKLAAIRPQDYPIVISVEWKFGILKKLIISAQMQLRVIGVTTMCTELLQLHHSSKGLDVTSAPVLIYFAEYILEHKLIDYIVGIGSHPEIILESGNILGFLIVTKRYTSQQIDKIWQTVTTSQDPRVVDAILRMLNHCHNLYDADNLLYLCQKAKEIPLEAFTPSMRELYNALFKQLISKAGTTAALPAPPYQLCVKLIRESSNVTVDNIIGYSEIQIWAATRFRELLNSGPKQDDRKNIYQECMKDILMKTPTVPGSICVVYTLLSQSICLLELSSLLREHKLTRLLVEVIESIGANESVPASQFLRSTPAGQASRSLLLRIIKTAPSSLTPELGERLWNTIVGDPSRPLAERNVWWQTLNAAVKQSYRENEFLRTCFQEYLPKLSPQCYTPGALEFSREAALNWLNDSRYEFIEENVSFESPALEQIWHMVLTAPSNTIDGAAIIILAEIYSQSDLIPSVSKEKALSIHLELVNRCLRQLKDAASKLQILSNDVSNCTGDESNLVSKNEFQNQERIFARSLAVLREFLRVYHTKQQFASPKLKPLIPPNTSDLIEGEQITFFYQYFDGNDHSEIKSLNLGHLNTIASLFFALKKGTSFESFKVYCGGRELELKENEKLKPLKDLNLKGLLLVKRCGDKEISIHGSQKFNKKTLEREIVKHYDDLWSYLSMHEQVAQEIYHFLKTLPVYDKLLNNFTNNTPLIEIFPVGQPFKSLYAVYGLREYVNSQSSQGAITNETIITRAISLTTAAISDSYILDRCSNPELRDALALQLVDFLIQILKEPALPLPASSFLDESLLERLLHLVKSSRESQTSKSHLVTARSFEAIIESSIYSAQFWNSLLLHFRRTNLLRELLLDDSRVLIRKSTAKVISETCTQYSNSLAEVSSTKFVTEFWTLIVILIPDAVLKPNQCEQVLSVSYTIFKRLTETSINAVKLEDLVRQWGVLLISHPRNGNIDQPESIDMAVHGLVNLLHYATLVVKSARKSISCGEIGTNLFRKHLFPPLSEANQELIIPRIPLLNSKTRNIMTETVFSLIKDDELQFWEVLLSMESLVSYAPNQTGSPYSYDLNYSFERTTSIRSQTGYVGLRNLSNTCYLNSLFTQLFMNVQFRSFMLSAVVADGGASQKLLSETQSLFSYMQNSYKKYVDPTDLASSIRTYEETQIDVTVQMDVDEFYNLLFDRWESQIFSPDAKQTFRSFYGGQLVQQVKSKECPHVSERLEPFSAIQCDIKGKSCLEESLQAYVDGEVMEGDNKYKCSTCDKHVDAVKRACLKEIPDNLIFHLKRFDFNLRTLQRSKINDHFSFPKKIDLRPYKVEYLLDNPEEIPEDIFELVGILVHSGTAESGHYYSYIRERSNNQKDSWIEFNDECVSSWDSTCMEGSCFGGPDYRGNVDSLYDKTWSAYMLFYQRCECVNFQPSGSDQSTPVRVPVPRQLSNQIASENEILMRKYCLYDPSHTSLTLKMLQNMKQINGGCCNTKSHRLERLALRVSLNHLDQVVARTKDLPEFSTFMMHLAQLLRTCAECSRDYLDWICECTEALRHLLIKNPSQLVRNEIASSILLALTKVKNDAPYAYGLMDLDDSDDELENNQPEVLDKIMMALKKLWDIFHINFRAWPEYFGLLSSIARIGIPEAATLLTGGYLLETLDIITADPNLPLSAQCTKMLNTISKRSASRPIAYDAVISLLWHMIRICDASQEPVDEREDRIELALNEQPIPFTVYERNFLVQYWTRSNSNIVVEKLLQINQNERATEAIIVELLSWDNEVDVQIRNAISSGIKRGLTSFSSRPFLLAAMIYCEHSKDPHGLQIMVTHITKTAARLENSDGKYFLQFFKDILTIGSCFSDLAPDKTQEFLLNQIPVWAPCLLTYYDQNVRKHTEDFIQGILLGFRAESDGEIDPDEPEYVSFDQDSRKVNIFRHVCQNLAMRCLDYLMESYIRPRQTVVRATLHNIQAVIEACEDAFEPDSPVFLRYNDQRVSTVTALKRYIVEEADQEVSDWDNSDAEYDGSSEPMDSIVEINGATDEDRLSHSSHR